MSLYSRLLESAILPGYNRVRGRSYFRHYAFLQQSQWWPTEKVQEFQWRELRSLLKHAFESVPYYRNKYAAAGISIADLRTLDDFGKLPFLTREEINNNRVELCSKSYAGKLLPEATGGSSGMPTRFFITQEGFDWRSAATQRAYAWAGCHLGERTLYLWGAPLVPQTAWQINKERLYHYLRRELVINTFTQTDEFWDEIWRRSIAFRPHFIVAYVSSLEQFIRHSQREHGRLRELRAVLAAAEPVPPHLPRDVEQVLRVPLFNTYGSREFMSIAVECDVHHGLHVNAENILLETERPSTEGPSEFLVTDLHNYGMPFIRYKIGDVGVLDSNPCPCGRGLPKINSIVGRTLDVLRGKDGRIVPGEFFPHLLKDVSEVAEFQVEQKSLEHIVLSVVLSRAMSDKSNALLSTELRKVFGDSMRVEIRQVEAIPRLSSGKRRVTIGLKDLT